MIHSGEQNAAMNKLSDRKYGKKELSKLMLSLQLELGFRFEIFKAVWPRDSY